MATILLYLSFVNTVINIYLYILVEAAPYTWIASRNFCQYVDNFYITKIIGYL